MGTTGAQRSTATRERPHARGPASTRPASAHPAGTRRPGDPYGLLSLQRQAGNRAVAALVAQRLAEGEAEAPGLQAERFSPSAKLQACLRDKARVREHDPDTDATVRVQSALLDLPAKTGNAYDLGPSGADGVYGAKTAAAVRKFKQDENLGFTQFGDVGPGTMRRLDEIFKGGSAPPPVTDEAVIVDAPPGINDGPVPGVPGADGREAPAPAGKGPKRKRRFAFGVDQDDVLERAGLGGTSEAKELTENIGEDGDTPDRTLTDNPGFFIWGNLELKTSHVFDGVIQKILGIKNTIREAVGALAQKGIEFLVNTIASAIGGPLVVGAVTIIRKGFGLVSRWFGGGEGDGDPIKWAAKQLARLIEPAFAPFDKAAELVDQNRVHFDMGAFLKAGGDAANLVAFVKSKAVGFVRERLQPGVDWLAHGLQWVRRTLAAIPEKLITVIPGLQHFKTFLDEVARYLQPERLP